MITQTKTQKDCLPMDLVLCAWDELTALRQNHAKQEVGMKNKSSGKKAVFEPLGNNLYQKGGSIYLRVQSNGVNTWLSTGTNDIRLALKWKENREHKMWAEKNGFNPKQTPSEAPKPDKQAPTNGDSTNDSSKPTDVCLNVDQLLDQYHQANHPIVRKRTLKRKAARTIRNENYCLVPLREFFGKMDPATLTLADPDKYYAWRQSGAYVAHFQFHGKKVERATKGGDRAVDLELVVLSNALQLAVRRGQLKENPLKGRGQYTDEATVRHCREVAPTPPALVQIVKWFAENEYKLDADLTEFLAYTGLRISEALRTEWSSIDWLQDVIHVRRSKKGVFPFVLLLLELKRLLRRMKRKAKSRFLFPSPLDPEQVRDESSFRRRLKKACKALNLPHVTPHGLRSYFVTQARQSGLTDAEIAQLIGDKSGPVLIAEVYGDVREDHLLTVARQIRLTAKTRPHRRKKTT